MNPLTFQDLVFKTHPNITGTYATLTFPNEESISVVLSSLAYSNGTDTYEAFSSLDHDPQGYLTTDEVTALMLRTQE